MGGICLRLMIHQVPCWLAGHLQLASDSTDLLNTRRDICWLILYACIIPATRDADVPLPPGSVDGSSCAYADRRGTQSVVCINFRWWLTASLRPLGAIFAIAKCAVGESDWFRKGFWSRSSTRVYVGLHRYQLAHLQKYAFTCPVRPSTSASPLSLRCAIFPSAPSQSKSPFKTCKVFPDSCVRMLFSGTFFRYHHKSNAPTRNFFFFLSQYRVPEYVPACIEAQQDLVFFNPCWHRNMCGCCTLQVAWSVELLASKVCIMSSSRREECMLRMYSPPSKFTSRPCHRRYIR